MSLIGFLNSVCFTMHAYFPELCSFDWSCEAFEDLRVSNAPLLPTSLMSSHINDSIIGSNREINHLMTRFLDGSEYELQSKIRGKSKPLRLVDGRLQVVGFNCDLYITNKSAKHHPKKGRIAWEQVLYYLMK